jgi:membrane-bound lytic murein transglycosylase D
VLKKNLSYLVFFLCLWGCSGTKRPAPAGQANRIPGSSNAVQPVLEPDEKMFFSEVDEFVGLGLESMKDSVWFQAGEDFDSALVRLSSLEATDSLSPSVYATINIYRDSVQKLLVQTVARTSSLAQPVPWTAQFDEEMQEVSDSSVKAMDSITHQIDPKNYDLPLPSPLDPRILQAMAVFMGPGRGYFTKWLERKSRYEKLVVSRLTARGLPKDLLFLAMCESGFNPKAWSKASASGMWQFISATGRRYGIGDDWWIDPRRDPLRATEAAIEYLKDLHDEFGDWHLAMAAYNCGENKIRKYLGQDSAMKYWTMPLPQETRFYVPKILAAMIIGHNPDRYGFNIENPEPELAFDTATVRHCLSISTIAKAVGATEDDIMNLNPSLRRWCTPPNKSEHVIYLPSGTHDLFCRNYAQLDTTKLVNWHHHIVGKGENLGSISARYRVSVAAIKATNKLKGNRLSRGQSLLIPLTPEDAHKYLEADESESTARVSKFKGGTYRVRSGDNLFDIARRFGTTVSQLLAVNGLPPGSVIKPGQRLKLDGKSKGAEVAEEPEYRPSRETAKAKPPAPASPVKLVSAAVKAVAPAASQAEAVPPAPAGPAKKVHLVKPGETLYSIAREHDTDYQSLIAMNGLGADARIFPGQSLTVAANAGRAADDKNYYVVKDGDSLWDISVKFRSTVAKLKELNGRLPPILKAGTRIRVK